MKSKSILQLILICIGSTWLLSCSDNENNNPDITGGVAESSLNIQLRQGGLPGNLRCMMYVFSKANVGDSYLLKDSIHLNENHARSMQYIATNWNDSYYRFLFVGLPSENAGITLYNHANADLTHQVDTWEKCQVNGS